MRGLRAKIIGLALLTLGAVLIALALYDREIDEELVGETRRAATALTEAIQVSVQQLGASTEPDEALLKDYADRLGRGGVKQITVLSPEKQRLAGSHVQHAFLIEEQPGNATARSTWDLLVPIVVGPDKLGYVQLKMTSADFERRLRGVRLERAAVTLSAFMLGIILAVFLARYVTRPMEALRFAAQGIARGSLDVKLPEQTSGDELGALVAAFREMLSGLRERDLLRTKLETAEREAQLGLLAARIAHDVRNPLNYLSLAIDHFLAAIDANKESTAIGEQMKRELRRADERITELLRLGRNVRIDPQPVAVRGLVEALAGALTTAKHPIAVDGADPGRATWDPAIVEEILRNLITNATQATPDGGSIELRLEDRSNQEIAIHVDDHGPGIDETVRAHLFEPWFTTKSEGIGLGLMLARKAARQHGGELSAESRDGGGARFTLVLPREARRIE